MLAIDANIILEVELEQEHAPKCKQLLMKIEKGELMAVLGDFTIDSIILGMERYKKDGMTIRRFLLSLLQYHGLIIYKTSIVDKIIATNHMATYALDFDDSLTLQTAFANNCTALVTLDPDFKDIKKIKILTPAQALAAEEDHG